MFVSFDKSRCKVVEPDFLEKTGNALLHCVARGTNVLYCVKQIPCYPSYYFSHEKISCCQRIVNIVICILMGPLTLLAVALGLLAYRFSSTYQASLKEQFLYECEQRKALEKHQSQEQKIITLQKFCRGFLVRKHLLNQQAFLMCQDWGRRISRGEKYPRVPEGRSLVYISKNFPSLIAKHGGYEKARFRGNNDFVMRQTLARLDIKHLEAPRARVFKDVIFEERLPVPQFSVDSMCVYKENPKAFDKAIKELLFLFKKVHFRDFIVEMTSPTDDFPLAVNVQNIWIFPRYDNLPLSVRRKKDGSLEGKIELIDLETLSLSPHPYPVEELAVMFPLHKELLISEAKRLHIVFSPKEVENSIEKGLAFFKHILGHQEFCLKKGVAPSCNCAPYISFESWRCSLRIFEALKSAIKTISKNSLEFLLVPAVEKLQLLSDKEWLSISSQITTLLLKQISAAIYQTHNEEAKNVKSIGTFIISRSPILLKSFLFGDLPRLLSTKLRLFPSEGSLEKKLAALCLKAVMEELTETGCIYKYDQMDHFFNGQYCRIRY